MVVLERGCPCNCVLLDLRRKLVMCMLDCRSYCKHLLVPACRILVKKSLNIDGMLRIISYRCSGTL